VYAGSYQETVLQSYSGTTYTSGTIDRWTPACERKASGILARGRQIIKAYDDVYEGYKSYAMRTQQLTRMAYRQLPTPSNWKY